MVLNLLKYCHFVFVFMDYLCGSHLVPNALVALKTLIINVLRTSFDSLVAMCYRYFSRLRLTEF